MVPMEKGSHNSLIGNPQLMLKNQCEHTIIGNHRGLVDYVSFRGSDMCLCDQQRVLKRN